jgi:hypothetical protein
MARRCFGGCAKHCRDMRSCASSKAMNKPIRCTAVTLGTFAIGHYLAAPYLTVDAPDAPPVAAITIVQSTASVSFDGIISVVDAVTGGEYQVRPPVNVSQSVVGLPPTVTVASLGVGTPGLFATFKPPQNTST